MLVRTGQALGVLGLAAGVTGLRLDHGEAALRVARGRPEVRDFRRPDPGDRTDFAVAHGVPGTDAAILVGRALDALGGMSRFVSRGDVVAIKPNIGWDRTPIQAANTNPDVVAELVRQALAAGARRVVVSDASCNDPARCFQRSGIWARAHRAGAEVVLPAEHRFRTMRLRGEVLDEWPVLRTLLEADKVINCPVAKHHNLARYTAAMKNWYGLLGGRRNRLHQDLDTSIADLATFIRPTLTVVDAIRVLVRNGPQGGNVDDTQRLDTILATTDQVAADAYGCTLIGQQPANLGYLRLAESRGLGTTRWQSLRPREVAIDAAGRIDRHALVVPDGRSALEVIQALHAPMARLAT